MATANMAWLQQTFHDYSRITWHDYSIITWLQQCTRLHESDPSKQVSSSQCYLQALLNKYDVGHLLQCLLTASWHKLHGASWQPVVHPDVTQLHFDSTEQTVAAARAGLDRYRPSSIITTIIITTLSSS